MESCDHNSRVFGTERDRRGESVREHAQESFCKNVGWIESIPHFILLKG